MMKTRDNQAGFTLIEMLIAVGRSRLLLDTSSRRPSLRDHPTAGETGEFSRK
jgi:hypothetical protein